MTASEMQGQPVMMVELDERKYCGACNYPSHRFFELGEEPNPESDDLDERGLCSGCFADMLAGEGVFRNSKHTFCVTRSQGADNGEAESNA